MHLEDVVDTTTVNGMRRLGNEFMNYEGPRRMNL